MSGTLFRSEVLAARKSDGLGTIKISPPRMGWFFSVGACAVLLTISCIAVFGRYSRTEKMTGRLVPRSGASAVMAPDLIGASISEVFVAEGDTVKRGQALLKIANQRSSAVLGDTGAAISSQLEGKLSQLKASVDSQKRLASLKSEDLGRQISLIKARIAKLDLQIIDQDQRTKSADELYETWRTKAAGVISGYQISQQLDTVLQQRSLGQDIRNQRLQAESELASSQAELEQGGLKNQVQHVI